MPKLCISFPIKFKCPEVFELFSETNVTVLTNVSCDHVTSFNYDGKKAREVSLTCCRHLSNIMPGSAFHERKEQGIACFFVFFLNRAMLLFSLE